MPKDRTPIDKILPENYLNPRKNREDYVDNSEIENDIANHQPQINPQARQSHHQMQESDEYDELLNSLPNDDDDKENNKDDTLMGVAQEYLWVAGVIIVLFVVINSSVILNMFNSNLPTFGLAVESSSFDSTLIPTTKGQILLGSLFAIMLILIKKIMNFS